MNPRNLYIFSFFIGSFETILYSFVLLLIVGDTKFFPVSFQDFANNWLNLFALVSIIILFALRMLYSIFSSWFISSAYKNIENSAFVHELSALSYRENIDASQLVYSSVLLTSDYVHLRMLPLNSIFYSVGSTVPFLIFTGLNFPYFIPVSFLVVYIFFMLFRKYFRQPLETIGKILLDVKERRIALINVLAENSIIIKHYDYLANISRRYSRLLSLNKKLFSTLI